MDCHGTRQGGVGEPQVTRVTQTDRDWRNKDVRRVEEWKLLAGISVQRELFV